MLNNSINNFMRLVNIIIISLLIASCSEKEKTDTNSKEREMQKEVVLNQVQNEPQSQDTKSEKVEDQTKAAQPEITEDQIQDHKSAVPEANNAVGSNTTQENLVQEKPKSTEDTKTLDAQTIDSEAKSPEGVKTEINDNNVRPESNVEQKHDAVEQTTGIESQQKLTTVVEEQNSKAEDSKESAAQDQASDDIFKINEHDIVLGDVNSKIVIIEYSSLSCPHCSYYHENAYKKIKAKYIDTGKIAYVLRNFIWNKQDLDGSVLALCDRTKFYAFMDTLYARQQSWAFSKNYQEILTNIGQLGGITPEKYSTCLNDEKIRDHLVLQSKQFSDKMSAKIPGTPAFIINGTFLNQPHSFNAISAELEKLIKNAPKS